MGFMSCRSQHSGLSRPHVAHRSGTRTASPGDDNFDDNRDDNWPPNYVAYTAKCQLNGLITALARSWQCGGQGFESPWLHQETAGQSFKYA